MRKEIFDIDILKTSRHVGIMTEKTMQPIRIESKMVDAREWGSGIISAASSVERYMVVSK